MRRALLIVAGLFLLLSVGLYVAATRVLASDYARTTLEQQLTERLGQPVRIGALSAAIYPRVAIDLDDVAIGAPAAVTLAHVRFVTGLRALFSRTISDAELIVRKSRLTLPLPIDLFPTNTTTSTAPAGPGLTIASVRVLGLEDVELVAGPQVMRIDLEGSVAGDRLEIGRFAMRGSTSRIEGKGTLSSMARALNGSGTDTDGTVVSYNWTQMSGTTATITSPSSPSTTITGFTTAGTRVFRLKVTDDKGATGISDVSIIVNPAPKAIPGRIEIENWDAKSGPQYPVITNDPSGGGYHVIGIGNGNWMDYNVNVATAGTYTVSFRVATTQNASQYQLKSGSTTVATFNVPNTGGWDTWSIGTASATLTAGTQTLRLVSTSNESSNLNWMEFALSGATPPPPNQAPTANAGTNQSITLPTSTASLSGNATDPDGTIASYAWTQVSGTAATIANPSAASTGISGLTTTGARVFRLTVADNQGATATSDVTITVNPAAIPGAKNIPGRIEAENWDAKSGPQYAVSTSDIGGGQQVVGIVNGSSMDYNVNVSTSGTYSVSFRVASTQLNAQLQLKAGTTVLGTVNVPNTGGWDVWTTVSVSNVTLAAGAQTIRVVSTNNETCNFNWFEFTLTAGASNQPPTANAGTNQNINLPTSTTTLSGNGSDPDGTIVSYAWTEVSGPVASIANPSSANTTISGLTTTGARVFRLTITDNLGATATSDVTVMVNAAASNGKTIPGRIEAENWDAKSGSQYAVSTSDSEGGQQVIGIANGNWMDYNVSVTTAGTYTVSFRVATTQWNAQFQIKSGNTVLATVNVPGTGGWSTWGWASGTVTLSAGNQTLRIVSTNNESCNLNWMDFSLSGSRVAAATSVGTTQQPVTIAQKVLKTDPLSGSFMDIYPNPVKDQFVLRSLNNYEGSIKIQVMDLNGRLIKELQVTKSKGRNEIPIPVNGLKPGSYFVKVQMGTSTQSMKMVKL